VASLQQQAEAIANSYEKPSTPANTPKYRRLTNADRAYILKLAAQKYTQPEIAQRIGCAQSTVSEWLTQCEDSTGEASRYLRGQALSMARKIVNKGKGSDLVATLKGINVLEQEQVNGITVLVGAGGMVNIGQGTPSPHAEVIEGESVRIPQQIQGESDK